MSTRSFTAVSVVVLAGFALAFGAISSAHGSTSLQWGYAHVGAGGGLSNAKNVSVVQTFDNSTNVREYCFKLASGLLPVHNIQATLWSVNGQRIAATPPSPGHDNCPAGYDDALVIEDVTSANGQFTDFYVLFRH